MVNDWTSKPHGGGRTDRPSGRFLDTTGNQTLGIGICGRCSFKFPLHMLLPDPNVPGLMVCEADRDDYDVYRLPARQADVVNLPFVRPDVPLNDGLLPEPDWDVTPDPVEPFPPDDPPS